MDRKECMVEGAAAALILYTAVLDVLEPAMSATQYNKQFPTLDL